MLFTTVRAKFYLLYVCMVLLLATIAFIATIYSWNSYTEKQELLKEYNVFRLSSTVIHMLQKERGLTVKSLFRPTRSNIDELKAWRAKTYSAIVEFHGTQFSQNLRATYAGLHNLVDSKAISPENIFLQYSDCIYEIISAFGSDRSFEHIQHDHLFLSLTNLLMAREHLGKIRAYISVLASNHHVDDVGFFYVKEKFGFYKVSKMEFLKSLKSKQPLYASMIVESEKVKKTDEAILLFLGEKQQGFDYDGWFDLSTGAMDVFYDVEKELSGVYGAFLENEIKKTKVYSLIVLCVTGVVVVASWFYVANLMRSFSSRVENIDAKMKLILKNNDYGVEITDPGNDEISNISNSLNSLLKFTSELLEEKEKMASTDRLTGIYNRTKFLDIFESEFQRFSRYKTTFSVIMVDIDHFKKVNDNCGHNVGDSVLIEVTSLMSKIVRATDVLVRWGGEEFVVLATSSDLQAAVSLAEKIRLAMAEHSFASNLKVTMSFGVAEIEADDSLESIMARADSALYESKRTGRNKVSAISTIK
ncbi:putative diguanylate cyclase YdaM [Fundidesulfovibrio magnetotacticus]|uniref:diguanylate cyclase n=1 Tax=Fundidesulfovibrio magnetotacticus TaxID=2730080 RepID=A0A6V8LP91_9BACT|nr:diguanylate cyclase [Fundidesulfovibrio magnetotacticus]GFK92810.1 putative diguanylate cyclase YdaM [Fundidesulfovibrio magnetotacticus]